ncbi:hypothetical protein CQ006_04765 [Pseudomonas cedrina]|uniref:Uncharacterized protein n=2 Tax=Pseudomonas TaxID=286 RepID=A0A2S9E2H8_PSECE|nr:hypothetical protein CLM72_04190 [Pseudomonas sp. MYb193]PRC09066.1 hypothetical protein CQ006_04765 [Pseudomonas cedrina]
MGKITEGKTMPNLNSPNGCYQRHGYTVERTPRKGGAGHHRAIYDQSGQLVLNRAGYDAEIQFCIERGLMLKEDQAPLQSA